MLDLVVELFVTVVFEGTADLLLWLLGRPVRKRQTLRERLEKAKIRRRNRAIRRWLKKGDRRGPIPNIGLTCPKCQYSLTGLTEMRCPECGRTFHVETMIDHAVGFARIRRRRNNAAR